MSNDLKGRGVMIGLEIHCQMTSLHSKLFCTCKADYRGMKPNENICPVCMGLPGTLPRLNGDAVQKASMIAMALNCEIPKKIAFFRKNYFYPDLPKNFQITQLDVYGPTSIGGSGHVVVGDKPIRITRVQLEEDPGRMIYEGTSNATTHVSLVDYNRAGAPLVEIVTEPDFDGPRELRVFLQMLSGMLENMGISNTELEGAMRADANVSVSKGNRVEVKNIGSFHELEKAVKYEITRQETLYARGLDVPQETRHWDAARRITTPSRSKEDASDYRYTLEGDIPWVSISNEDIDKVQEQMPESSGSRRERFINEYGVSLQVAGVLSSDKFYSDLFDAARTDLNARDLANMITSDLMGLVDSKGGEGDEEKKCDLDPVSLGALADAVASGGISRNQARSALYGVLKKGQNLKDVVESITQDVPGESDLIRVVQQVIDEEAQAVQQAKENPKTVHYLVGKVMRKTKGKADPDMTLNLIKKYV